MPAAFLARQWPKHHQWLVEECVAAGRVLHVNDVLPLLTGWHRAAGSAQAGPRRNFLRGTGEDGPQHLHPVTYIIRAQTGMRKGEVSALQNQDLDLLKGTAFVRRTWTRERLGPPKTRRSRAVSMLRPVTEDTAEWCLGRTTESRRILEELRALPVQSINAEAFVFGIDKPWSPAHVLTHWRRVLKKAGVRYRFTEQPRHTFASGRLGRGANLLYVQKQGGWKNASVLLQVYTRYIERGEEGSQALPDATQPQPRQVAGIANGGQVQVERAKLTTVRIT